MRLMMLLLAGQVQVAPPIPPPPPPSELIPRLIEQTGELTIEGEVRRTDNGDPLGDVQVTLTAPSASPQTPGAQLNVMTDSTGRFVFQKLPPAGGYTVQATKENHFAPPQDGRASPSAIKVVTLSPLQKVLKVTLNLIPGGTITGTVRDINGQPASNVDVMALKLAYRNGARWLQPIKTMPSDDRGIFRLWGLPPGEFYLRANPGSDGARGGGGTSGTYYPGVENPEIATLIKLKSGDETLADLQMRSGRTMRISGKFLNTIPELAEEPMGYLLMPRETDRIDEGNGGDLMQNQARGRTDGSFEIIATRPGLYDLMPVSPLRRDPTAPPVPITPGSPMYFTGRTPIEVGNRDVENLTVAITRGVDVNVHVSLRSVSTPLVANLRLGLRPADEVSTALTGFLARGQPIPADGNLTFRSVPSGRYTLTTNAGVAFLPPSGMYLADLRQASVSVYDHGIINVNKDPADPVEVIFAGRGGTITGNVETDGKPAESGRITLIPQGPRRSNALLYKRAGFSAGRFVLLDIPPGDYKIYAWKDLPADADENATFMAPYESQGRAVSIRAGGSTANITLPLIVEK